MKLVRYAIVATLVLVLAACGGTPTGGDETGSSPVAATAATQANPSPAVSDAPLPDASGLPLALLSRSGGLLGESETLVVQSDGQLVVTKIAVSGQEERSGRATPEQIQKLQSALQAEGWQQLDPVYGEQVPDGYAYMIVANGKSVQTYDGAQNPAALETVLSLLNELWPQVQG